MWFIERMRESVEALPLGGVLGGMREELTAKASLSSKLLHSNVLTPENIPEFFIPPRLSRRAPPSPGMDDASAKTRLQTLRNSQPLGTAGSNRGNLQTPPHPHTIEIEHVDGGGRGRGLGVAGGGGTSLCGAHYGLMGLYESPNTRRKESLFLSEFTGRSLERAVYGRGQQLVGKPLWEQGSIESDTPSSCDSSPRGSPVLTRSLSSSALLRLFGAERPTAAGLLSRSASKLSLLASADGWGGGVLEECVSMETHHGERVERAGVARPSQPRYLAPPSSLTPPRNQASPSSLAQPSSLTPPRPQASPTSLATPSSLSPPVLFPLDLLHCQERLQREHVLPLEGQGRGRVRLSAELDPAGATLRIRVVSVEDLHDSAPNGRLAHCCVSLCLTPGKRQRQNSAVIRNCRNPVFNEDFFFTELTETGVHTLALRLKVLDKASSLKRDMVLGVTSKPLSQLLPL